MAVALSLSYCEYLRGYSHQFPVYLTLRYVFVGIKEKKKHIVSIKKIYTIFITKLFWWKIGKLMEYYVVNATQKKSPNIILAIM